VASQLGTAMSVEDENEDDGGSDVGVNGKVGDALLS